MSDMDYLDSQRNACLQTLDDINHSIRKYEKALKSLEEFKIIVANSQNSFNSVNMTKYAVAEKLNEIQQNCLSAEEYFNGTNATLNGFGGRIVGIAFEGLEIAVNLKCASYKAKIVALDAQFDAVNSAIQAIDAAKKAAQAAEG